MMARMSILFDWIFRAALINLLWLAGTLLGAVLLGLAPATIAAHHVAREFVRQTDGRVIREFWRVYRSRFWDAQALLGPPGLVLLLSVTVLVTVPGTDLPGAAMVMASCALAAAGAALTLLYLPSLSVHYDVPVGRAMSRSFMFAVAKLPSTIVLVVLLVGVIIASIRLPGLMPVLSVGTWILGSTALCLRFYAQNDDALEAERPSADRRRSHAGHRTAPQPRGRPTSPNSLAASTNTTSS